MRIQLDHLVVRVADVAESVGFYTSILGLAHEGQDGPFTVLRVTTDLTILLAPWKTEGNEHYAFALSRAEFDAMVARLVKHGVPYGDAFDTVGSMRGPGRENGARGTGRSIYFFDPSRHLLEIMYYED